jgi:hypothetical protein
MRTLATITAFVAMLTTSTALAQGPAPPPTQVGQSGPADTEIQATWPTPFPPYQTMLTQVAATTAPPAGAGVAVGRGGGPGLMPGQRGGMGPMAGRGDGMRARPTEGFRGPGPRHEEQREHARRERDFREHFRRFPYGYPPGGYMNPYPPNNAYYNNQSGYSPYGGSYSPNYGYGDYPYYGYNYSPSYGYNYYPYYGYNSWPNFFGYNYWNPAYSYGPNYGY